jgi:hypothetical protein
VRARSHAVGPCSGPDQSQDQATLDYYSTPKTRSNVSFSLRTNNIKALLRLDAIKLQSHPRAYDGLLERSLVSSTPPQRYAHIRSCRTGNSTCGGIHLILILILTRLRLVLRAPSREGRHAARVAVSGKQEKSCSRGERSM